MNDLMIFSKLINMEKASVDSKQHRLSEPAFMTVSMYSSNNWGTQGYDHNLMKTSNVHKYNVDHKTIYSSELANQYYGSALTNSITGSSNNRGNSTVAVSHLGHNCIQISPDGEFSFIPNTHTSQTTVGTWVNNTTPHLTIHMENSWLWISTRAQSSLNRLMFGELGKPPGLNDSKRIGTVGYNEKIKKLAILESNDEYGHRLTVWEGVKSPAKFGSSKEFFDQLTSQNMTQSGWCTANPSSSTAEDNYRGIVVVCDNSDVIVTKMVPSKDTYSVKYEFVPEDNKYIVPDEVIWKHTYTTSYGFEQGNQNGIRFQISNNGKYVAAYSPTYYYGSGINLAFIEVSSGKVIHTSIDDSSYGYSLAPLADQNFILAKSINADSGVGMTTHTLHIATLFNNTDNGEQFKLSDWSSRCIDTSYYSTCYPYVVPVIGSSLNKFVGKTGNLG